MTLEELGYDEIQEKSRRDLNLEGFTPGRVVAEHRERYIVWTESSEWEAEVTGSLRFTARSREDFPAVGDWVALSTFDPGFAIIHAVLARSSLLKRHSAGKTGDVQVIGANIDYGFLVQAVDRDFNLNRLERYLAICHSSGIVPVVVLTKTDLITDDKLSELVNGIRNRENDIEIYAISNVTHSGYDSLMPCLKKGKTHCLLGSSGVGKSTLINNLMERERMKTGSISTSTQKGRHVTSHRELFILENGAIIIDNPGMREVGLTEVEGGMEKTFVLINELSELCKYRDCTHIDEAGCAVLDRLHKGEIDPAFYENYIKMMKEKSYFETTAEEKRKKERRFGKMLKDYKKGNYKNRD